MNPNYYLKQRERALVRKLELLAERGNKCEICGYNKNIAALDFHHLNPKNKSIQLDSRHLSNTSTEKISEEFKKCIVVCANCHRELHNAQLDKNNISNLLEEIKSKHASVFEKKKKMSICEQCGKEFEYSKGKKYCSKECRDIAQGRDKYPTYEEIIKKYNEFKSWEKVADFYGVTRKILKRIRQLNKGL